MQTLKLEINLREKDRRIISTSSKGDQIKWCKNGYWFKANSSGYEDIAEWAVSNVLACSNLPRHMYVPYRLCEIKEEGTETYKGCVSQDFLLPDEILITIGRLLTQYGIDIDTIFYNQPIEYKVAYVLNFVKQSTGVDLTRYLRTLLTLDALVLNEDRHFHNIALIYNKATNTFRFCPIFDNGLSLLSDIKDYPQDISLSLNIDTVQAKPFSISFDKQMQVLGTGLKVNGTALQNFINTNRQTLGRAADVLEFQMNKYKDTIVF